MILQAHVKPTVSVITGYCGKKRAIRAALCQGRPVRRKKQID